MDWEFHWERPVVEPALSPQPNCAKEYELVS